MKDEILANIENPVQLEKLYRTDKPAFKRAFDSLYPELKANPLAEGWNQRLNYEKDEIGWGTRTDLFFVLIASLVAGIIAKLPALLHLDDTSFYTRNASFIIFPLLSIYFAWKNKLSVGKITLMAAVTFAALFFINFLPNFWSSNTLILSCIHLPFLLWSVLGFAFVGDHKNNVEKRLGYLSYNGDLLVMTALILAGGAILSGVTIGLFSLIGIDIRQFYFENIALFGLAAAPIIGTYLIRTNPLLVGKVSPVIAKIFSPLVLVMLVIYLVAIIYSGKDPYNDREFLLIFNALLIGVMAIIFFSIAETTKTETNRPGTWILFLLSLVTIVVSGIALSAILYRITLFGITPNRAAVLGGDGLIFIHLLLVTVQLVKVLFRKGDIAGVARIIAFYLPVYSIWAIVVTFLFPLIFDFK